ncbi:MAG: heavy metal-responsive transcriptional regulator [Acidimicrobiia bacterium]
MQIGEVARKVGVATSAIRFYEESGLLPEPERTRSGYREYAPAVIDRLIFIRAGQAVGFTLAELKEVLGIRDRGDLPCSHVAGLIDRHIGDIDQRIRDLRRLRKDLAALKETAAQFDPTDCPPESVCRILTATG